MATVSAVDSMNQTYALFWGMLSFLLYIKLKKLKYIAWIILVFVATLCKENGLMWALICPILAFGFSLIDQRMLKKDLFIGCCVMMGYAAAILLFPKDIVIHPEYEPGITKAISNTIKFLFTSFIHIDYIYLLHAPSRNILLAVLSFLLALPFFLLVFIRPFKMYANKKIICTLLCLLIAIGPHVLTVFSMMHTYAGLPLITIILANGSHLLIKNNNPLLENSRLLATTFVLFLISAVAIDIHLYIESYRSGLIGKQMAQEAISETSSFCVIPSDAFGWGIAAKYETNYQWPVNISDTIIVRTSDAVQNAKRMAAESLNSSKYECVWIINHQDIEVIKK